MSDFGILLRTSRQAAGLTKEVAAQLVGVTTSTLSSWESGRHKPHALQAHVARQCIEHAWRDSPVIDRQRH